MVMQLVSIVVVKLGDLILKEAQLLGGVRSQVENMKTELGNIQYYLIDADSKGRKGDASAMNWLNQLRDVAYRIEDAIDTFYLELEDNLQVKDNNNRQKNYFFDKLRKVGHKAMKLGHQTMNVPGLHKLGTELGNVQMKLEEIFKSRDRYEIRPLQAESSGSEVVMPHVRRAVYQDVDETEIVGLDADINNIIELLHTSGPNRAVITIVGTGGLGKTTLARMVYNSVKAEFQIRIMLSVSKQFSLTDLLKQMLKPLIRHVPEGEDSYYVGELRRLLSGRKYLIFLDDVWGIELWDRLKYALPDDNNDSRVLITSRITNVATSADSTLYKLEFLNDAQSLDLLIKKALPHQECLNDDMRELADNLSKKCKGLPLALVVLGSYLKTKGQSRYIWKKVLDTMNWHDEGKDCMKILAMSYEDMPYDLKVCFLFLAFFPEDYEISVRRLLTMWTAEEFIPRKNNKTKEEAAEFYFDQLFERSMIQVSSRYPNGSIKRFRVHDLLRDLAMHEAGKDNFLSIFTRPQGDSPNDEVCSRRVSLQSDDCRELFKYIGPTTRSLLCFGLNDNKIKHSVDMFEFRLIRVVEIEFQGLDRLIHLKYLGFINCATLKLPNNFSLGCSKKLETLDVKNCRMSHESSSLDLWTISTLRHVMYQMTVMSHITGPPSNAHLIYLQTLKWVEVQNTWHENQLPRLNNLRKLGLLTHSGEESVDEWKRVGYLLGTLPYLLSFGIMSLKNNCNIPKEIVYPRGLPDYQNLQTLHLNGEWAEDVTLEARLFPQHLVKLKLVGPALKQDPMPELGKLNSLKKLHLIGGICKENEMICPTGFPVLETLHLELSSDIKCFTVMKGVMPKLNHLTNKVKTKLKLPPELRHFFNTLIKHRHKSKHVSWTSYNYFLLLIVLSTIYFISFFICTKSILHL